MLAFARIAVRSTSPLVRGCACVELYPVRVPAAPLDAVRCLLGILLFEPRQSLFELRRLCSRLSLEHILVKFRTARNSI